MSTPFLIYNVHSRRDVVLARDWARQVAALLGFEPLDQACIAALVFEIASQAFDKAHRAALHFQAENERFQVFATLHSAAELDRHAGPRLEKPLPKKELAVALEDIAWVVCQLAEQSPASLFAEIKRQNQELLYALAELQAQRGQDLATAREPTPARPAA